MYILTQKVKKPKMAYCIILMIKNIVLFIFIFWKNKCLKLNLKPCRLVTF